MTDGFPTNFLRFSYDLRRRTVRALALGAGGDGGFTVRGEELRGHGGVLVLQKSGTELS